MKLIVEKLKDINGITCNCGIIHGGTAENTVPDKCIFTADIRFRDRQQKEIAEHIVQEVAEKSFVEGTSCKVVLKSLRPAMEQTEENMSLLKKINQIYADVGMTLLEPRHDTGGADSAYITECGLPCLDGFGVISGRIHSKEEYAYLDSLKEAAKKLAVVGYYI